jgi:KaiC/GvpD/RAD55 family RecA-like ATPase
VQRIPTGVNDLDGIIKGGVPVGSTVLLFGELGAGNIEFAYTSAAKLLLAKIHPERKENLLGYTAKTAVLPERIVYITFSRSKEDILREINNAFSDDFYDAISENVEFKDFSREYFRDSVVPSRWSGDSSIPSFLDNSGEKNLLAGFVNYIDSVGDKAMIIVDSLTDLLINESINPKDVVMTMKGLQRVSKRWNGVIYFLLARDVVEKSIEQMIVDSVDGVFSFTWSKQERSSRRQRYLYVEKFTSLFPHLGDSKIARFVTMVTKEGGYIVINMERI